MILEWLNSLISHLSRLLLTLFVSTDDCEENCLNITFKCSNGEIISIPLDKQSTVKQARDAIFNKSSLPSADCVKIIFAGRELPDDIAIGACDLANGSILHIVEVKHASNKSSSSTENESNLLSNFVNKLVSCDEDDTSSQSIPVTSCLTVYCPSCQSIQPGRMRVRCTQCKETAVILSRDPRSWSDVLTADSITGDCHNSSTDCHSAGDVYVQFFFKCSNKSCNDSLCIPLTQVKMNSKKSPCLSCGDTAEKIFRFECTPKSQHSLCLYCFCVYSTCKLNDRQFCYISGIGYTLECPMRCENSFIRETNHFRLLDKESDSKYEKFALEASHLASGAVFCPSSKCSQLVPVESNTSECIKVTCTNCLNEFGSKCRGRVHSGECPSDASTKFAIAHKFTQHDYDELASYSEIFKISKPCPGCKTPTERDSGCMHMTCTMAHCKLDWCWLCESKWSRECMAWHWFDE